MMDKYQEALNWIVKTLKAYESESDYGFSKKGKCNFLERKSTLQELVQKATPKKCYKNAITQVSHYDMCPNCNERISPFTYKYCPHCGQRLDWSNE